MGVRYVSTNGGGGEVCFRDALIRGQAPDLGLYVPAVIPRLTSDELYGFRGMEYHKIAYEIAFRFLEDDIPKGELARITRQAYDFDVPVERVHGRVHVMRLDRGPTASFKDFAARMMARLMHYYLRLDGGSVTVLTATSGDTGSAVANAFHGLSGVNVVVLFPEAEVTDRQRRQMTTLGGNVTAVAVDGKFDDCQSMVKKAFADKALLGLKLSSANSINFGRLLPQTVYYFWAHSRVADNAGEKVVFSVPSGNFGDIMGGVYASMMGLPVERFIAATNENDEFPRFMASGGYKPLRPSKACISNAMNVGHPSNLARLFNVFGGWMDEQGRVKRLPDMDALRRLIWSVSVTDERTRESIRSAYSRWGVVLEPHGAVGWSALEEYLLASGDKPAVLLETADPAKFPGEIVSLLGFEPKLPDSMSGLESRIESYGRMRAVYNDLRRFLLAGSTP